MRRHHHWRLVKVKLKWEVHIAVLSIDWARKIGMLVVRHLSSELKLVC